MPKFPFRLLFALSALLLAAGCETPATSYAAATEPGGYGITESRIDDRTWTVSFAGNAYTTREQVENSVLYRAAEIARAAGAEGFIILKEEVEREERLSGPYYGGPYGYPYYGFAHFGFHSLHGYPHRYAHLLRPIRPYYGRPREEFTVTARIRLYRGSPPPDLGTPYEAADVLSKLQQTIPPRPSDG